MGIDYNVYMGPYIECVPTKGARTEEYYGCPKCQGRTGDGNFCHSCGTRMGMLTKQVVSNLVNNGDRITAFESAGLDIDSLSEIYADQPNEWFTGNSRKAPGRGIDPKHEFGLVLDEEIDAASEKQRLSEMYAQHIEVLKSLYGEDKVAVKWGVISYTS